MAFVSWSRADDARNTEDNPSNPGAIPRMMSSKPSQRSRPSGPLPYRPSRNNAWAPHSAPSWWRRSGARNTATEGMTMEKPVALPRPFTVADAHALADRLERNQRPQSDQAMAVKLIRALLAGRAAGDVIVLQEE
jgi:hypothetical protein